MTPSLKAAEIAARTGPFFIVMNAASGHNDADEERQIMAGVFENAGRKFEFLKIDHPSQISEVCERAVRLAAEQRGVVVAAGGDGTINAVASAVLGTCCPFGVLPQGTFNYFGRVNAIPQETHAAAVALLNASVCPVQVGEVNGRIFLVNASLGLYPQLLEDREAWKQQLGRSRLVAFLSGLSTLLKARGQLALEIELAGQRAFLRTPTLFNIFGRIFNPYAAYLDAFGPELEPQLQTASLCLLGVKTTRRWRHKNGQVSSEQIERVCAQLAKATPQQLRVVVVHQPVHVLRTSDQHDRLRGWEPAVRAWAAAGADVVMGGHIHLPYVSDLTASVAGLGRRMWCVQAGTALSSRVRREAPNSVNLLRYAADDASLPCQVERWDFDADAARFALVKTSDLRLDRAQPRPAV